MVLALFFGSGATALVYEVVWAKFLAQMFGSTSMRRPWCWRCSWAGWRWATGFLALGGRPAVAGEGVWRAGNPDRDFAFLFPALDHATNKIFIALGSPIADHAGWLLLLKGILSALLLLGPTILMGGTLRCWRRG